MSFGKLLLFFRASSSSIFSWYLGNNVTNSISFRISVNAYLFMFILLVLVLETRISELDKCIFFFVHSNYRYILTLEILAWITTSIGFVGHVSKIYGCIILIWVRVCFIYLEIITLRWYFNPKIMCIEIFMNIWFIFIIIILTR